MNKKLIFVISVVLMILCCSCGVNKNEVKNALQGEWSWSDGSNGISYYFEGDKVYIEREITGISLGTESGNYKITSKKIDIDIDGSTDLPYSFENGELILYAGDGTTKLEK